MTSDLEEVLAGRRSWTVVQADVMAGLALLPDRSVQCVVCSPPFWGLRDYGTASWAGGDPACQHTGQAGGKGSNTAQTKHPNSTYPGGAAHRGGNPSLCRCGAERVDGQVGLERTPQEYVDRIVAIFREVRRVLRDDGTLWLELGDSYNSNPSWGRGHSTLEGRPQDQIPNNNHAKKVISGLKPKDLIGIPWRVAFALQDDGWWLRADVVWHKPNPMPESVLDRPTRSHDYLFLLTKAKSYFYDAEAVREPQAEATAGRYEAGFKDRYADVASGGYRGPTGGKNGYTFNAAGRNKRDVWTIPTEALDLDHFAAFPTALVEPCVLAGTSAHGCCSVCGAPWRRVLDRTAYGSRIDHSLRLEQGRNRNGMGGQQFYNSQYAAPRTTGWAPTCPHADAPVVPCLVLDPFLGSGTTVMVALRHGRRGVGIELNPKYAAMARQRITDDAPMFNTPAPPEERPEQMVLL